MRVVQELEGWLAQQKGQQQCRALEQYSVVRKLQLVSWGWADGRAERGEWKDRRTGSQRSECHMSSRTLSCGGL